MFYRDFTCNKPVNKELCRDLKVIKCLDVNMFWAHVGNESVIRKQLKKLTAAIEEHVNIIISNHFFVSFPIIIFLKFFSLTSFLFINSFVTQIRDFSEFSFLFNIFFFYFARSTLQMFAHLKSQQVVKKLFVMSVQLASV